MSRPARASRIQAAVHDQLNEGEFAAAWADGQAMSTNEAVQLALSQL
jgi:hypothetical protein